MVDEELSFPPTPCRAVAWLVLAGFAVFFRWWLRGPPAKHTDDCLSCSKMT